MPHKFFLLLLPLLSLNLHPLLYAAPLADAPTSNAWPDEVAGRAAAEDANPLSRLRLAAIYRHDADEGIREHSSPQDFLQFSQLRLSPGIPIRASYADFGPQNMRKMKEPRVALFALNITEGDPQLVREARHRWPGMYPSVQPLNWQKLTTTVNATAITAETTGLPPGIYRVRAAFADGAEPAWNTDLFSDDVYLVIHDATPCTPELLLPANRQAYFRGEKVPLKVSVQAHQDVPAAPVTVRLLRGSNSIGKALTLQLPELKYVKLPLTSTPPPSRAWRTILALDTADLAPGAYTLELTAHGVTLARSLDIVEPQSPSIITISENQLQGSPFANTLMGSLFGGAAVDSLAHGLAAPYADLQVTVINNALAQGTSRLENTRLAATLAALNAGPVAERIGVYDLRQLWMDGMLRQHMGYRQGIQTRDRAFHKADAQPGTADTEHALPAATARDYRAFPNFLGTQVDIDRVALGTADQLAEPRIPEPLDNTLFADCRANLASALHRANRQSSPPVWIETSAFHADIPGYLQTRWWGALANGATGVGYTANAFGLRQWSGIEPHRPDFKRQTAAAMGRLVRTLGPALNVASKKPTVALLFSKTGMTVNNSTYGLHGVGSPPLFASFFALTMAGFQPDIVLAEELADGKASVLTPYPVLYITGQTDPLSDTVNAAIRAYLAQGGTLLLDAACSNDLYPAARRVAVDPVEYKTAPTAVDGPEDWAWSDAATLKLRAALDPLVNLPGRAADPRCVTYWRQHGNTQYAIIINESLAPLQTVLTLKQPLSGYDLLTGTRLEMAAAQPVDLRHHAARILAFIPAPISGISARATTTVRAGETAGFAAILLGNGNQPLMATAAPATFVVTGPDGETRWQKWCSIGADSAPALWQTAATDPAGLYSVTFTELLSGRTATFTIQLTAGKPGRLLTVMELDPEKSTNLGAEAGRVAFMAGCGIISPDLPLHAASSLREVRNLTAGQVPLTWAEQLGRPVKQILHSPDGQHILAKYHGIPSLLKQYTLDGKWVRELTRPNRGNSGDDDVRGIANDGSLLLADGAILKLGGELVPAAGLPALWRSGNGDEQLVLEPIAAGKPDGGKTDSTRHQRLVRLSKGQKVYESELLGNLPGGLLPSPHGKYLWQASDGASRDQQLGKREVTLYDAHTGKPLWTKTGWWVFNSVWSQDGEALAVVRHYPNVDREGLAPEQDNRYSVSLIRAKDGCVLVEGHPTTKPGRLEIGAGNSFVIAWPEFMANHYWLLKPGQDMQKVEASARWLYSGCLAADGTKVFVLDMEGILWCLQPNGVLIWTNADHQKPAGPDLGVLTTCGDDLILGTTTGKLIKITWRNGAAVWTQR